MFHELIHGAQKGGVQYTHTEMAKAAYAVGVEMGFVPATAKPYNPGLVISGDKTTNDVLNFGTDKKHSFQFDQYLKNACDPSFKEWNDGKQFGPYKN